MVWAQSCKYGVAYLNRDNCKHYRPSNPQPPLKQKPKITSAPIWVQDSKFKPGVNDLQQNFVDLMNLNMKNIESLQSRNSLYFLDDKWVWTKTKTLMGQNPNTYKDYDLLAPVRGNTFYSFINITTMFMQFNFYLFA